MSERVSQDVLELIIKDRGERSMCPMIVEDCLKELKFLRRMEKELRELAAKIENMRFGPGEYHEGYQGATDVWLDHLKEIFEGIDDERLAMSIES